METTRTFEILSTEHLLTLLVCAIYCVIFAWHPKYFLPRDAIDKLSRNMGIIFLTYEVICRSLLVTLKGDSIISVMPLHLCAIAAVLCAVMLLNHSKLLFDVMYYVGIVGALISLLTPDLTVVFPEFGYLHNFFGHSFILGAILFMMVNYNYRPSKYSLFKAVAFCNIMIVIAAIVNGIWDTNFLFLCEKPHSATLMDYLGPWPYYIIGLEGVGLFFFVLLYAPYFCYDRFIQRSKTSSDQA